MAIDPDLGMVRCADAPAVLVRVLVKIEPHEEDVDPEIGVPDPTLLGLRVCRRVSCALKDVDRKHYFLTTAGVCASVQWLLTAAPGMIFFVQASVKTMQSTFEFRYLAFKDVVDIGAEQIAQHIREVLSQTDVVPVTFDSTMVSPKGRKRATDDALADSVGSDSGSFAKRRLFS